MDTHALMERALALAEDNVRRGGWPFSAVLIRGDAVLAEAVNEVHQSQDPTDHAEMVAIRMASRALQSRDLSGSTMVVVGLPCPMCLAACIVAGVHDIVHAVSVDKKDAALSALPLTQALYSLVAKDFGAAVIRHRHLPEHSPTGEAVFAAWNAAELTRRGTPQG